jgi:hypothetical protein
MDNDTIAMNCERAEDELSGYLDDVLDPRLRRQVEAHLATCEQCQTVLADFRRADELVRQVPFIEPPSDMRDRFFNSPSYLKLATARAHQRSFVTPLTAALVAAAMLVVALGGALLLRHGVSGPQQVAKQGTTTTIGNPSGTTPLPAGVRLIFARDHALWSAPEDGAGLPKQLTPAGIQVAGWCVAPNMQHVVYIDAKTGALHTIRADGLNDTAIGSVTGGTDPSATFWTTSAVGIAIAHGVAWSPDNTRIAYLAQSAEGTVLHVVNATGVAYAVVNPSESGLIGRPLWSANSNEIAFTSIAPSGAQSIVVYNVATAQIHSLATQGVADDSAVAVGQLAWQSSARLTWSASIKGKVTGVFSAPANASGSVQRLTPTGSSYTAADVSSSGAWLLANGATLSEIAVDETSPHVVANLVNLITQVQWSPTATTAAVISGDALLVVTPGQKMPVVVAHELTADSQVAWLPKSDVLAWQSGQVVMTARMRSGAADTPTLVVADADAGTGQIAWSIAG